LNTKNHTIHGFRNYGKFALNFGQIQPLTLLAKLLVQSIDIWDKWKRVELSIDIVFEVKFNICITAAFV